MMRKVLWIVVTVLAALTSAQVTAKEKVRLGYWTSGVSMGFGAVLEAKQFLEAEGLDVEYVRFPDLASQIRALASGSIDITFGTPLSGVYAAVNEGVPIRLVAATQLADAVVVVPEGSPIRSLKDLKGKKVGGTSPVAAVSILLNSITDQGYGIGADAYTIVSGNESRLVQFLVQKQVDAAVLRSVTVEQVGSDVKLKTIASLIDEWKKMTKSPVPPYIGTAAATADFATRRPETAARVIRALIRTEEWGKKNSDEVVLILKKHANLPEKDARAFASRWKSVYRTSFDAATISTLKLEYAVFNKVGVVKGPLKEEVFVTGPYKKAAGSK